MASEDAPQGGTLADKIDRLFRVIHPPDSGEYSSERVAKFIQERGGKTISGTYIWQLRVGLRDNPTKHHLEALASFFQVDPSYFFDEALGAQIGAELELLAAMREAGVHHVAMRAAGLSPKSLDAIRGMIESAREMEGLETDAPRRRRDDNSRGQP